METNRETPGSKPVDLHNNSLKSLLKLFRNRFLDQITRSMIEDFKAGRAKEFKKGGSVRKAHDNVCEKIGLRGAIDLYNLRHTFAIRSILSGTDVTILKEILGHSEIGMTMRYVKIAEHYKVEAVVKLEKYRALKMQEAVVKMQQEEEKLGMLQ